MSMLTKRDNDLSPIPISDHIKMAIQTCEGPTFNYGSSGRWSDQMPELVELLNANPKIKFVDLSINCLTDEAVDCFLQLKYVDGLSLGRNDFHDDGAIRLMQSKKFKVLDFYGCSSIKKEAGEFAINHADELGHLIFLNLNHTHIPKELKEKVNERFNGKLGIEKAVNFNRSLKNYDILLSQLSSNLSQQKQIDPKGKTPLPSPKKQSSGFFDNSSKKPEEEQKDENETKRNDDSCNLF
jgi:hypothetical protein